MELLCWVSVTQCAIIYKYKYVLNSDHKHTCLNKWITRDRTLNSLYVLVTSVIIPLNSEFYNLIKLFKSTYSEII